MSESRSQHPRLKEEDVNKLLQASDDLMQTGLLFSHNIDAALHEFKAALELSLKTHFLATAVAEMMARSFESLEKKVLTNLEGINNICTEGGQWYSFYLGTALGRVASPPKMVQEGLSEKSKSQAAS
jgi:hypothetical protein